TKSACRAVRRAYSRMPGRYALRAKNHKVTAWLRPITSPTISAERVKAVFGRNRNMVAILLVGNRQIAVPLQEINNGSPGSARLRHREQRPHMGHANTVDQFNITAGETHGLHQAIAIRIKDIATASQHQHWRQITHPCR